MAYIGRSVDIGMFEKQVLTADSSTTTFTLTFAVGSANSLLVVYGGVIQEPGVAYSVSGGGQQIAFSEAPVTGTTTYIIYLGKQLTTPRTAGQETTKQTLTGDGTTTLFTLTDPPVVPAGIMVFVDGILQREGAGNNYVSGGSTINFNGAPDSGAEIDVYTLVKEKVSIDTVVDGSITRAKMASTFPYWNADGNFGVGASSLGTIRLNVRGDATTNTAGIKVSHPSNVSNGFELGNLSAVASNDVSIWNWENGFMRFATNNTERARIDSSGRFFVGTTAVTSSSSQSGEVYSTGAAGFLLTNTTAANYALSVKNEGTTGTRNLINFYEGTGGGVARANISLDSSNNFAITSANSTTFTTASVVRMSIDTAGAVAISTAVASAGNNLYIRNPTDTGGDNTRYAGIQFQIGSDQGTAAIQAYRTNSASDYSTALTFLTKGAGVPATNPTEKMRLGADGQLMVGTTAGNSSAGGAHFTGPIVQGASGLYQQQLSINSGQKIQTLNLGVGYTDLHLNSLGGGVLIGTTTSAQTLSTNHYLTLRNTSGAPWGVGPTTSYGSFYITNSGVGVYLANGGTSWTAQSDERTKTALVPFTNALDKVSTLRTGTGRYLTDAESVSRSFMIAQDFLAVLPEAVDVGEDEQGTLGLRYTEVIPLLTAAIQELKTIVEAQAVEIAALKAK